MHRSGTRRVMTRGGGIAALIIAVVFGVGLAARQKPNFSGRWIIEPPSKGAGQEIVVKQDDKTLSLTAGASGRTLVHQLNGAEQRTAIPMRGGEVIMLTKAAWEGDTIVVTIATDYPNKMKTVAKEIWSIDAQGRLVIDSTETAEGQAAQVVNRVTHVRKS